jgi:magnesium transporter
VLTAYVIADGCLVRRPINQASDLTPEIRWIDLNDPTEAERQWVRAVYGQELLFIEELGEIEASSRYYRDEHGLHLHLYFLRVDAERARNIDVAFTVNQGRIFTLHAGDIAEIRQYASHAASHPELGDDPMSIMIGIVQIRIGNLADGYEKLHNELESLSRDIFSGDEKTMPRVLERLARVEDINGKARLGMVDNQRVYTSLVRSLPAGPAADGVQDVLRDNDSLLVHSNYLFEKAKFLMDSAMGMIDIAHNKRLNIFTILSVVLMPPTLIASIYGMNFKHMPELEWLFGYPFALLLMLGVGLGPILYLKSRDWI